MRRTLLNDGWTVRPKAGAFEDRLGLGPQGVAVTLPHDAVLGSDRSPSGDAATAFYEGGEWDYRRTLERPREAGSVYLEFEGVYRDAIVSVNDDAVAHRPYGYAGFVVPIDHVLHEGTNRIRVEARAGRDSRWYSGGGLYRSVWLLEAGRVHLAPGGLRVLTPEVDDDVAAVTASALVHNRSAATSRAILRVEVADASGVAVATAEAPATCFPGDELTVRQRLYVPSPRRWGPGHPYLYTCRVSLREDDGVVDEDETTFGIRTLSLDPVRGLRINGEAVLLRGACVHHDNGPLGAATFDRAEERRVELLREAGFNAIRSAHNPVSKAMLAACDRLGVLVMDETFDMWEQPKTGHDYALRFAEWWEADVEAMVRKDLNHPSVVLYSIGNEIPEAGLPRGARTGRAVAEKVRALDPTRFVTQAVSGLLVGGPEMFDELRRGLAAASSEGSDGLGPATATTGSLAERLNELMTAPSIGAHSAEPFSYLDVAGYNYMEARYEPDGVAYPNRVIVGTETHPGAIDTGWAAVCRLPQVIGDFTWTGWDYLGEAGIGRTVYADPDSAGGGFSSFHGEYPWRAAWCGDIDITGHRRPQSYYREIVFGRRADPYVAVLRPQHHGKAAGTTPWSWSDSVGHWSWDGHEDAPVTVEVYADADEVELTVNGRSVGTRPAGAAQRFRARFDTVYEPGLLQAVARRGGAVVGRTELRSAKGPVRLGVEVDRPVITAHPLDLAYVSVSLVDDEGAPYGNADREVGVSVDGPGILQALGSANPVTTEGFGGTTCRTFDGRALAVVRPTGPGRMVVAVTAHECEPQAVDIDVSP